MTRSDERLSSAPSIGISLPATSATESAGTPSPTQLGLPAALFISLLAFLLASSPARNSDVWLHLANGRLLASGEYPSGTNGELPPDHSWLYDLLCYGCYRIVGGSGLVICKALLVVGLALLLLHRSRNRQGWWTPAVCTVLALLTMSIRLTLQPATVSCLFLALTLWLVQPSDEVPADRSAPLLPPWPLLVLFVVWVNLDRWFVLGLGVVALVWLGQILDAARRTAGVSRLVNPARWLSALVRRVCAFAVLGAVCLLNPAHIHAFALPEELGSSTSILAGGHVTSPFQGAYFTTIGGTPAGLAYFPFLGLGLLSFLVNLPRWRWQRFLPWLGLALLSVSQVRGIPFFAVATGPVLAWNLQDAFAGRFDGRRASRMGCESLALGRGLTVAVGLVLLVCAWPGWLQAPPFEPRRWAIELPPSVERVAAAMNNWHQQGKLGPDTRGLHLSATTIHTFAWLCPEEKGVLFDRLVSNPASAPDSIPAWRRRMRSTGINHVILYNPDRQRLFVAMEGLLAAPEEWPLLYESGDLAVFGWRDPTQDDKEDPFRSWQLDMNRLAFHPVPQKHAPSTMPDQEPEVRQWWEAFWKPLPPRSIDREEAMLHLFHAEALRRSAPARRQIQWQGSQLAAVVGAASGWTGPVSLLDVRAAGADPLPVPRRRLRSYALPIPERRALRLQRSHALQQDDMPPALLYLAVRAARRALAVNPDDARAYLVLGESYLGLLYGTRERIWGRQMKDLVQLRHAQASAALNQAVTLKPDFAQAHLSLAKLYQEMGYLDRALEHFQIYFQLFQKAGPPPEVRIERFREEVARFQENVERLAKEVAAG